MDRATGRLLLLVGAGVYAVFLIFQLLAFMGNVGLFHWQTLAIVVQIALAVPVLAFAVANFRIPIWEYTAMLGGFVAVLAVSGFLGVSQSGPSLARQWTNDFEREEHDLQEQMRQQSRRLELQIEKAQVTEDNDKAAVDAKIGKLSENVSEAQKKELGKKAEVLAARQAKAQWDNKFNSENVLLAYQMNSLVLIGAFIMMLGGFMLRGTDPDAARAASRPSRPAPPAKPEADEAPRGDTGADHADEAAGDGDDDTFERP